MFLVRTRFPSSFLSTRSGWLRPRIRVVNDRHHNKPFGSHTVSTIPQSALQGGRRVCNTDPPVICLEQGMAYPNALRFDLSSEQIVELGEKIIAESKDTLNAIAAVEHPTWDTILQISDESAVFSSSFSNCYFPAYVSTDKSIRDAASATHTKLEAYQIEKSFRHDLYTVVKRYSEQHDASQFSAEENRYLEKLLEGYKRNGLDLEETKRKELEEVKKKISELCIKFQQNLNEDTTFRLFSKEELPGMTDDFLADLEQVEGKYKVTLKYPHMFPVLEKCSNAETRKTILIAAEMQCIDVNVPILEEVILLRQEEAKLLGYKTHAEYVLAIKMAKNSESVLSFLNSLNEKLTPVFESDLKNLLELKKEETGDAFDGKINAWDFRYYHTKLIETKYQVEEEKIKEYFPIEHVTGAMLSIYQSVLGLTFKPTENPHVWFEGVSQYDVYNAADNAFIGHFYLDLHPREGKYGHAAEFDLSKGCLVKGQRQNPVAAMVANFTKPLPDKPALLKHDEVVTYFHEFGHVMHELMTTATFHRFAGTNVQGDFVETPSQMLENWCYEEDVLKVLSKHYVTGDPLPDNFRNQLVAARFADAGLLYKRQLFFGLFDMTVHTLEGKVDTAKVWHELRKSVAGIPAPEGTNGASSFGHLTGGYSAGYYGYLWSEVFSADLFMEFKKGGVLNKELGMKYRKTILAPGGSKDASELLEDFLGRKPTQDAFLAQLGLQ